MLAAPALELSIVVPLYNEEGNVRALVEAVRGSVPNHVEHYELILVSDGSTDGTWRAITEMAEHYPQVVGLELSRNFGHQGALWAGLHAARGRAVVSMDGDLQHPPEMLGELLDAHARGYQVVNTQRADSQDTSGFKRLTSRWFYDVFSKLSGVRMEAGSSDFRLLDRTALEALLGMNDGDLFIRGLVTWLGFKTIVLPYTARERHSGVPKFTLKKMVRFATGALLSFSALPLRLGIWIGFLTSFLAFLEICYILVRYSQGGTIAGWASLMTILSFMFGVLFVLIGIVGTYLGKIYEILKGRPRFVVGRVIRADDR